MIASAIPYLVCFMMFIVGTNLTTTELNKVKQQPANYVWGTLGQLLLLPLLAGVLIFILSPSKEIAVGMLLVSLCPAGAISNLYAYIAKANVALSVTLTTLTNLISIVTMPLVLTLLFATSASSADLLNFAQGQLIQLATMLFFPMLLGALCQHYLPKLLARAMKVLEPLTLVGLLSIIVAIFVVHFETIKTQFMELLLPAASFTILSVLIANIISRVKKLDSKDTMAFLAEFPSRNLALVAVISVTLLNNSQYLVFAAMFFVVESPILLFLMLRHRRLVNKASKAS